MRLIILIVFTASAFSGAVSQTRKTAGRSAFDTIIHERECTVLKGDYASKLARYNFGKLFTDRQSWTLGFIEDNYQRLFVHFSSIRKDARDTLLYYVSGKTSVKANICDFDGKMVLTAIRRISDPNVCENSVHPKTQGVTLFEFSFREKRHQESSGVFEGNAATCWYLDSLGRLRYDDLRDCSDGFINNAFVGSWRSYGSNVVRVCNWGDLRIPNSGDLDIGAGEFYPSGAYRANGWAGFDSDTTKWWK